MKHKTQDPKYWIEENRLVGQSGTIPDDEPIFILRGRDINALDTLTFYADRVRKNGHVCSTISETEKTIQIAREHEEAVIRRILDFLRFRNANSNRMKQPDTDLNQLHDGRP